MGTNYYLHTEDKPPCDHCGRKDNREPLHIGKSSAGWVFSLHVMPELGLNDLADWEREWSLPGTWIENEYGDRISPADMRATITERSWPHERGEGRPSEYLKGPNGLSRHRIGPHCTAHGAGTWDLIPGDFS